MSDLTEEQVANLLNIPPSWIATERRKGRIPHVKYGRHIRFTPEQVEQIRQAHAVGPKSEPANPFGRKTRGAR